MEGQVLLFALVLLLVAGGIYLGHRQRKRRQAALRALARRLGVRFHPDDPFGLQGRYEDYFPTLRRGSRRYAFNVVAGRYSDHDFYIFDHHHETRSDKSTHHHHRSFVLLEMDVDLGRMEVRPEGFFDRIGAALGFDDIDFESEEFSRRYLVKSRDRKLAYDVFCPEMIEYFLTLSSFRFSTNGYLGLFRQGSGRMSAREMEATLGRAGRILELLPRYLRKDRAV